MEREELLQKCADFEKIVQTSKPQLKDKVTTAEKESDSYYTGN